MLGFHFLMVWALPLSFIPFFFLLPCQLPSLSSSILGSFLLPPPPEFPASVTSSASFSLLLCPLFPSFLFSFFLTHPHTLRSLASLGIGGNLERCRLMTAETCVGHSGLVSGNTTGIQTRTSDILFFLPYALMSSEQLQPHVIQFKVG